MLAVLKVLTILVTAVFGIYGSLVNFRDAAGRVTHHGWIGLIGVVLAGTSAAALQLHSEAENEETTRALQDDVRRSLQPLPGLTVSVGLRPDWHNVHARSYLNEILKSQADIAGELPNLSSRTAFGEYPFIKAKDTPLLLRSVCELNTELFFYRKPIPPSSFKYDLSNSGEDLRIRVVNPCWFATLPGVEMGSTSRFGWEFDLREGQLHRVDFVMPDVPISPKSDEWSSNSKISSLQDLLGAQLIVQARTGSIPPSKEIAAFRQSISVAILVIRLPSGVVLQFDADNLTRIKNGQGDYVYFFTFPKTMTELLNSTRYDRFKQLNKDSPPICGYDEPFRC
jgi:hypothetical protein